MLWATTGALPLKGAPHDWEQLKVGYDEGKITPPQELLMCRGSAASCDLSGVSSGSDHRKAQKPLVVKKGNLN